jgi:hypothetical protein
MLMRLPQQKQAIWKPLSWFESLDALCGLHCHRLWLLCSFKVGLNSEEYKKGAKLQLVDQVGSQVPTQPHGDLARCRKHPKLPKPPSAVIGKGDRALVRNALR